jgi:hypothetical protein
MSMVLESRIVRLRRLLEEQYATKPTGCGVSFGEILCHELHTRGLTFSRLAEKWGVSLPTLGRLIADHCERLERDPHVDHRYGVAPLFTTREAQATQLAEQARRDAKPRITADEPPAKKAPNAKPKPPPPVNFRNVTMSCCRSSDNLRVGIHVSAAVASRLGLKKGSFAEIRFPATGVMTIKSARDGVSVLSYGGDRLTIQILAKPFGILEKHRAESVVHHFGLEDELSITLPAWWSKGKQAAQKPKDGTPVSCKKMAGTNPAIKCSACQKVPATVECSRCPTLLCDACWDPHVRTHWHSNHKGKAATAARDARHAMRGEA